MSVFAATLLMLAGSTADFWMVYDGADIGHESILFVNKSERTTPMADGWVTFSYYETRNGSRARAAKSTRTTAWVNCKTREYINDFRMEYGSDGAMLLQGKLNEQQRRVPAPGSAEGKVLAFVCGDTRGATQLPPGAQIVAYADSVYEQGHPQVAKAPATPSTPPARAPAAAPHRVKDFWLIYTSANSGYEEIAFIDRSSISSRADGKTTFIYIDVLNGSQKTKRSNAKSRHFSALANCQTREFANELVQSWGDYWKDLGIGKPKEPPAVVAAGSASEKLLNFACGSMTGATQVPRGIDPVSLADEMFARANEAKEPSATPGATPRTTVATPERSPDFWLVSASGDFETVSFVDKSTISQRPDGWTAVDDVDVLNGSKAADYKWERSTVRINCKTRQYVHELTRAYDSNGFRVAEVGGAEHPLVAKTGSTMGNTADFVCRKSAGLVQLQSDDNPVEYADFLYANKHPRN